MSVPSPTSSASPAGLSGRRLSVAMLAVYVSLGLTSLEMYLANVALPNIAADLRVSEADVIWVVNVYQIATVTTLMAFAALGEIAGHQRLVITGIVVFTVGSLIAALAPSLSLLLVGRALQGLGAAAIVSVNGALLTSIVPPDRLGRALSINPLVVSTTMTLAPTIASAILLVGTWPWLFALNVPVGLFALVLAVTTLPKLPRAAHGFDIVSAVLSGFAVGLIVLGISMAARAAHPAIIVACLIAGVLFGWLLMSRQKGHPAPILPVDLFRIPAFSLSTATALAAYCAQGLAFVPLPFLFQDVMGRSAVETGLLITPWPVLLAITAPIAGRLADRYSAGLLGTVGLAVLVVGMGLLTTLHAQSTTFDVAWRLALCGLGFGFFQAPNLKAMLLSAPRARAGSASGMVGTSRIIGQALGAAFAALCYVVASGASAAALAFSLGAAMSAIGIVLSVLRIFVKSPRGCGTCDSENQPMNSTPIQPASQVGADLTPRQRMLAAIALYGAVAIGTLETSTANIALPAIAADLHVSEASAIWVVNIYQIGMVATLLPIAALGEIIGYQRIAISGLAVFVLSAIVCALAPNLPVLLIGRAFMGAGAAGIMGVTGAMLQFMFPGGKLGRMLGYNATVVSVGVSLGPTVAGLVLSVADWHWLFAVNVPIGTLALIVQMRFLPQTPRAAHGFDFLGAALAMSAAALVVAGISVGARETPLAVAVAMLVVGVMLGAILMRRQRGHPAPMLPVDLLRIPLFALSIGTSMCTYAVQALGYVALPFFVQNVMHRSAVETGMIMTVWPAMVAIMGLIAGPLADRYPAGLLGSIGLAILGTGMALLATLDAQSMAFDATWRLAVCGVGFGFFQSPNLKAIMTAAPRSRAGGASGSIATARLSGQAIGAASVALSFLVSGPGASHVAGGTGGATLAFMLGAAICVLGLVLSLSRLAVSPPAAR